MRNSKASGARSTRNCPTTARPLPTRTPPRKRAREEYRALAERRVRLGLVLSKIGEEAGVEVSDEELQRSLFEQVRRFPGQEQEIYEYFQKTPGAVASLRAPIFEEKTIDHLMTVIDCDRQDGDKGRADG
jgi:FKBP-type peptidyl-prolyl cis-trans isomerase (trigger factor)